MRIQYAISLWNFSHYAHVNSLEQELGQIRELGCGVELWGWYRRTQNLYSESRRLRLKQMLGDMPVSMHSALVHSLTEHKTQVDAAHDLGARVVVVHPNEFFADEQGTLDVPLCRDVVAYAAEWGVCIALENLPHTGQQLPFLEQAIAAVDGLRICLDVGHIYSTDTPMRHYLTTLKSHIVHLHLHDTISPAEIGLPDVGAGHYIPGSGSIPNEDWELLAATLREIGFDGTAVFEIRPRNPYQTARLGMRFLGGLFCCT